MAKRVTLPKAVIVKINKRIHTKTIGAMRIMSKKRHDDTNDIGLVEVSPVDFEKIRAALNEVVDLTANLSDEIQEAEA